MIVSEKQGKLNNSGFSLVEVLIAIVILAIISLPVLSTFSNSARINAKARRTENANTAINNIVEEAKAQDYQNLLDGKGEYVYKPVTNKNYYQVVSKGATGAGKDYFTGVNNQKFYIRAAYDKSFYTESGDTANNPANDINSYGISIYSDISSNNNYVYRDDTIDANARTYFAKLIGPTYKDDNVYKKTTIDFDIQRMADTAAGTDLIPTYKQLIKVSVRYTYDDGSTFTGSNVKYYPEDKPKTTPMPEYKFCATLDKDADPTGTRKVYYVSGSIEDNAKNFYIFLTPFSSKNKAIEPYSNGEYANDTVEINYTLPYNNTTDTSDVQIIYQNIRTYIMQQEKIDETNNRKIVINGDSNVRVVRRYDTDTSGVDNKTLRNFIKIYSTIPGGEETEDNIKNGKNAWNLGSTTKNADTLYRMTVEVWMWKDGADDSYYTDDNRIAKVITTKSN